MLWESLAAEHNDIFVSVPIIFNSFATKVGLPLPLDRNYRHALRFLPLAGSSAQVIPAHSPPFFLMGRWGLLSITGTVSSQQSFRTTYFSNRSEHYPHHTLQTKVTGTFLPHKCQNMDSVSPSSPKSWWLLRSINHIPVRALSTSFSVLCTCDIATGSALPFLPSSLQGQHVRKVHWTWHHKYQKRKLI